MTNPTGARTTPLRTLADFLVENAEPLINAAAVLGGRQAVRRTARLIEDMASAPRLTRRLGRDLVGLHRLLSLDAVDDPDSLEASLFAEIDPASPIVEEICLLTDALRDRLEALAAAEGDQALSTTLAQAA